MSSLRSTGGGMYIVGGSGGCGGDGSAVIVRNRSSYDLILPTVLKGLVLLAQ
ncbi:hypothetical protein Tco_0541682, partial [Tanacetum coccineum]